MLLLADETFGALDALTRFRVHEFCGSCAPPTVTTGAPEAAANFGLDAHPVHAERYERAADFLDAVTKLWDSWEDGALVADRSSGHFTDTDRPTTSTTKGRW